MNYMNNVGVKQNSLHQKQKSSVDTYEKDEHDTCT